jgi:hypothetical protein
MVPSERTNLVDADADEQAQRDIRVLSATASKALAWSSVKLLDGIPLRPRGG